MNEYHRRERGVDVEGFRDERPRRRRVELRLVVVPLRQVRPRAIEREEVQLDRMAFRNEKVVRATRSGSRAADEQTAVGGSVDGVDADIRDTQTGELIRYRAVDHDGWSELGVDVQGLAGEGAHQSKVGAPLVVVPLTDVGRRVGTDVELDLDRDALRRHERVAAVRGGERPREGAEGTAADGSVVCADEDGAGPGIGKAVCRSTVEI